MIRLYLFVFFIVLVLNGDTGCAYQKKIKTGEMAYDLKQYAVAVDMLITEFEEYTNPAHKAKTAFLLGKSYENLLEYNEALQWYSTAEEFSFGLEASQQKAKLYKQQERYLEAINVFENLKNKPEFRVFAERELLICKEAIRWKAQPEPYQIEQLIESPGTSHYSAVPYRDRYLVITSDRSEATGKSPYTWTGKKFSDLFLFTPKGEFLSPFDPSINSEHNDGAACFTLDFNTIYFTRCQRESPENDDCKIMKSTFLEGAWSEPVSLSFTKDKIQYGHPVLMENDSVLIFSTDLGAPGIHFDLYYCELQEDGNWSEPYPMPGVINTSGNEKFPTSDGDTLYFSSDYLSGMGGLDIFKTYLRADRRWSVPENMKYPINSGADDFGLVMDPTFKRDKSRLAKGFFSSSRSNLGVDEIYSFTKYFREDEKPKPEKDIPTLSYYINGRTYVEKFENDDPNNQRVEDEILPDTRVQLYDPKGNLVEETRSSQKGIFLFTVESEKSYTLKATKPQHLSATADVDMAGIRLMEGETTANARVDLVLSKIYLNKEIILQNIYYEFDQFALTKEAYPTLEKLLALMVANPMIKIQLNAHTDCRGDDIYNMDLSQKRANSVVEYLIKNGINADRLVALGYGETLPFIDCACESCKEEEHQKNRRTSFTIISASR